MRLPHPVYAGDTLRAWSEVLEARLSQSRSDMGIVRLKTVGVNQDGVTAIGFERTIMVYRQGYAPAVSFPGIPQ